MKYKLFPWLIGLLLLAVILFVSFGTPSITHLDPSEKRIKATFDAPFTLHFSHIMHRQSVEDAFMILPQTEGEFRWKDFWTLEFVPDKALTIGDEYRIVIKSEAKSIWMKKLGYDVTIDYKVTGPPFVQFVDGDILNGDGAITVMFDRPMILEGKNMKELIQIEPPLSGDIEDFGLSAFQFLPDRFKANQSYEITIPAGLSAMDGGETTEDYSWIITTPDLKVKTSKPADGSKEVALDWPIRVYFESEAPLEGIKPGINALLYPSNDLDADSTAPKMDGFFNTEVTYELDEAGEPVKDIFVFTPTFDYQPGVDYRFVLKGDKDLRLEEDYEISFRTLGETAEEGQEPEEEVKEEEKKEEIIKEAITKPAILDDYSMQFFIRGENPRLRLDEPLSEPAQLSVCQVSSNEFIRVSARNGWKSYRCQDTELEIINPVQKNDGLTINLNDYFKLKWATGVYHASIKQGDERIIKNFMIEDTTLLMKRSGSDLLVWALDVKTGKPMADMDIEVMAYDGETVARGKTDEMGVFSTDETFDAGIYVRARKDSEDEINRWGIVSDRWILNGDTKPNDQNLGLFVLLNQHVFSTGDTIQMKGIWRDLKDEILTLPRATQVTVVIEDLQGNFVASKRIPMRRNGSFDGLISVPGNLASGTYLASVADLNHQRISQQIPIQVKNEISDLRLEWLEAKADYAYGSAPELIAQARYRNGISAGKVKGSYKLYRKPVNLEHQKGAVYYKFNSLGTACETDCESRELIATKDFEFDSDGEARLVLMDENDKFLPSGYRYEIQLASALPGDESSLLNHSFEIHQGLYDLGLGVKHSIIDMNGSIEANILALDSSDTLLAGQKVKLSLSTADKTKKIHEETFETELRPVTISFPITPTMEDGVYLLQARSLDDKRNEIVSEQFVYVNTNPLQTVSDELLLAVDQQKYFVGGRAHLLINEPSASEDDPVPVVLTYERDGLLGYKTLELTSPVTPITVPITESMVPDFNLVLTRFNRGVTPSFTTASRTIEAGNDESQIFVDISHEPLHPKPGDEVTFSFKTYDYQNRPLSAVLTLNLLNQKTELPAFDYSHFFPTMPQPANTASNISPETKPANIPIYVDSAGGHIMSPAESVYFDPLITTNSSGETQLTVTLPKRQEDLFAQVFATKDSKQYGSASAVLHMSKSLQIEPILPSLAAPGDQTTLSALIKNISDQPVQDRLEFSSPDLSVKGDSTRNFSLQPGQQTEMAFSVFIDTALEKDEVEVTFKSGRDEVKGTIRLRHLKSSLKVPNTGLLSDIWTGRVKLPQDAYTGLGNLAMTLGASPLTFVQGQLEALRDFAYPSTYLLAAQLLLEEDSEKMESRVLELLSKADGRGAYRLWNEPSSSPTLTAMVLLAYIEASDNGIHIDSIQLNRTIDYLLDSLDQKGLNADEKSRILWVLGKSGQLDTERALAMYQEKETLGIMGKAFLLMNLRELVEAGQSSLSPALDALKAELVDEAVEQGDLAYFNAPAKETALALYALCELGSDTPLMTGLANYLASQEIDLRRMLDPEEALWTILAFKDFAEKSDSPDINYITQVKVNGELVMDHSVTGDGHDQIYRANLAAASFNEDGINDVFVKKDGTGPLYFDAYLDSFLNPTKTLRTEDGFVLVRKMYELTEEGEKVPATNYRKGKKYVSELRIIVPEEYGPIALRDFVPAGMKFNLDGLQTNKYFTKPSLKDGYITYYSSELPAGVYKISTPFSAVLSGSYQQFPASIQAIFDPSVIGQTKGTVIEIVD